MMIVSINCQTGETTTRPLTAEEQRERLARASEPEPEVVDPLEAIMARLESLEAGVATLQRAQDGKIERP